MRDIYLTATLCFSPDETGLFLIVEVFDHVRLSSIMFDC